MQNFEDCQRNYWLLSTILEYSLLHRIVEVYGRFVLRIAQVNFNISAVIFNTSLLRLTVYQTEC